MSDADDATATTGPHGDPDADEVNGNDSDGFDRDVTGTGTADEDAPARGVVDEDGPIPEPGEPG